jgi:hypothetical protein
VGPFGDYLYGVNMNRFVCTGLLLLAAPLVLAACGGDDGAGGPSSAQERLQRLAGSGYAVVCRQAGNGEAIPVTCNVTLKGVLPAGDLDTTYTNDALRFGERQFVSEDDFGMLELEYRIKFDDGITDTKKFACARSVVLQLDEGAAVDGGDGHDCG